jgi:DNA-binding NtrC family response regulator
VFVAEMRQLWDRNGINVFLYEIPYLLTVLGTNAKLSRMQAKKILLIEDSPDLSFLYKKTLSSLGFEIEICDSGRSALENLATSVPDLILMDLTLGDISVEDFFSQFSAMAENSKIPLALISGREDLMKWAELFKASFFAKKPVDMGLLRKAVQEILVFDEDAAAEEKPNLKTKPLA